MDSIKYRGARYYHFSLMEGADGKAIAQDIQSRQSFVSNAELKLNRTCGVYVPAGGQSILFIIDLTTVAWNSDAWHMIARIALHLVDRWPLFDAQAKAALKSLYAVTFSTSPNRAYADVKPKTFAYDVDEFRAADNSLISVAYAVSNIVHDANHIRQFDMGFDYTGPAAEQLCWQLQIDNAAALGLAAYEVDFLKSLVARPELVAERLESQPFGDAAKVACSALGKCTVGATG